MEFAIRALQTVVIVAGGSQDEKHQLRVLGNELDAFSEEVQRRPEVRTINKFAVVMAYIRIGLNGIGALMLLWATVVLLGGFVSDLTKKDFWYLTIIAFVQAAGLSDAMGDDRLLFFGQWTISIMDKITSWGEKNHDGRTQLPMEQWLKRQMHILQLKIIDLTLALIFGPVVCFAVYAPILCVTLSALRVAKQDYGIADGDASKANLKPALNLFYYVSLAQSAISFLCMIIGASARDWFLHNLSQKHGFSHKVLAGYFFKTKQMCLTNPASTMSWNFITYGADLFDSQSLEDYALGGRVLTMLIDLDTPVPITWLLNRSPRQRIQKLIGTLAWKSPAEKEMRWLAARIVEHLAGDLNLAHFPGALECISSLFDTSCHNSADQEALHVTFVIDHSKQRKRTGSLNKKNPGHPQEDKDSNPKDEGDKDGSFIKFTIIATFKSMWERRADAAQQYNKERSAAHQYNKERANYDGTGKDLVLPGLRILERLAHDRHNCTLIYNTKDLISKIIAPVSSNKLVEDIKSNAAWTKVVDVSLELEVVGRIMGSSGSTGEEMRSLIADDRDAVKNLEAILEMDTERNNSVIELQMRVIEVLTQLSLHHPASTSSTKRREKLIKRVLHIFVTTNWLEDYLKDEKRKIEKPTTSQQKTLPRTPTGTCMNNLVKKMSGAQAKEEMYKQAAEARVEKRMKEAKETASRLKAKAGEALAMLSGDSEAIKSFTGCNNVVVHHLTQLLDSKIKTVNYEISATDTPVQIEIDIGCHISAAVILKHLSDYDKEPTLRQVLVELLPIQAEANNTTTLWCSEHAFPCITATTNDIENPGDGGQDESSALQSNLIQQCGERRLRAELLSLVAAIRASSDVNLESVLLPAQTVAQFDDFVVRFKKMVEDNMYATPACLAIHKLSCEMVIEFIRDDRNVEVIDRHNIVGTLVEASEMMAELESSMLFAGVDHDCHGVPLKPLSSVLAKNAEDLLAQRKQALGINTPLAVVLVPTQ